MKHSLFFNNRSDAEQAVARINATVLGVKGCQIQQSGQAGTVEVYFRTDSPLEGWVQRYIVRVTKPAAYDFNQP